MGKIARGESEKKKRGLKKERVKERRMMIE